MFESLAQKLLNSILGEYIENFSAQNLKIGIWSGEVILKNVVLKKSIIKKLNLPLKINYSRLGCLKMNIPWKSLTSSKIQVLLEGFQLIVSEIPVADWECKNTKIIEKRKKQIESYCETVIKDFAKKSEKEKSGEEGYFSKLIVKIIDNLQVTIRDIHIRYEDQLSKAYSFGITLQEFKLYTVNLKGNPQYIDRSKAENINQPLRKKLQLYNIGVYWNQKSEFYNENNYEIKMASTIAKRGQKTFMHNYLILMTSQAQLLQREPGKQFNDPQINLDIDLQTLKIELSNIQLQQIITLAQRLQRYTNKVKEENRQKLTQKQIKANQDFFNRIFPDYYSGKDLSKNDNQRLQKMLQKMQVQHFTKDIKLFLQQKQKQRIIKQKKQQKKGWWFGKPKQLTKQQLKQVEDYLNDNFGQQIAIVKRPSDYYYIKIGFKLERLQIVIANALAIIKQGIQSKFDGLDLRFKLRDGGYCLQISLDDIGINLFKQIGVDSREEKPILYKLNNKTSKQGSSYLNLVVTGNPLSKKHLDTDIKLTTSQLIILFDPKIISIATEFADFKLSQQNKEAAIQKFGQIKEITQNVVSETINKPVKKQIGVDVVVSSIWIVVPFVPIRPNSNCWVLNLGVLHFTTDEQVLMASIKENQPLNIFNLQMTSFSFRHYASIHELKQSFTKSVGLKTTNSVVDNLNFQLRIQIFSKATEVQQKIKIVAILPSLSINLNNFVYNNILKIGDAFQQQEKIHLQRVTSRINEKKQIQQKASKIGFVHIKDSLTKMWKKYVAIMSQNYIYLYNNKADKDYYAFYYIKGAALQKYQDALDKEKPFHFKIKNKVNQVVFGFDKEQQVNDWMDKIKAINKQQQFISEVVASTAFNALSGLINLKPQKNHNKLNLFVFAEIEQIVVNVYTTQSLSDKVANFKLTKLSSKIFMHESKTRVNLQLLSLELQDSIQPYKNKHLRYFLQTKRNNQAQNLINLNIQQLNKDHPKYDHTDTAIEVAFGTLICNYKCQTVKTLMAFFIPPPSNQVKRPPSAIIQSDSINLLSASFSIKSQQEIYSLKLQLKIQQISVILVNEKVKTVIGKMGITNLDLYTGMSQKRMVLNGSLKDLYFIDVTEYPNTIYSQKQNYPNQRYLLTANIGQNKNMLDFNIQILKQLNFYQKKMLIDVKLSNLTAYYVQQPVLRIITYLNTQMLPSFQTEKKEDTTIPLKDTKPELTTMDLNVQLTNISVFVQTQYQRHNKQKQQYMQLNIQRIIVKNDSIYRPYIKGQQKKPIILVQNYLVALKAMSISVHYFDIKGNQNGYKLTNNLDLTVSTDLIANPQYYKKQLPEIFQNGLRVFCTMTPFFMRLNHDDYSFIMKCLSWAITHDDGLQDQLYNIPVKQSLMLDKKNEPIKDPFYLVVEMNCISVFITQSNMPIAFLLLDNMVFNFVSDHFGTQMDLIMKNLYGTSIQYNQQQKKLSERGIFNSLGYTSQHKLQKTLSLEDFIVLFDRRQKVGKAEKANFLKCIITMNERSTDIQVDIGDLYIDVDVRLLMILSTLANTDENYIRGPQPVLKKQLKETHFKQEIKQNQKINKKFSLLTSIKKLVGSVSDYKKEKFVIVQGQILFTMINYGDKTIEQIQFELLRKPVNDGIIHSSMKAVLKNFSIYFSKIKQQKFISKRQFLRPMLIDFDQQQFYTKQKDIYFLSSQIRLKTNELVLLASLKDILIVNKILQDNLKVLSQFSSSSQKPQQISQNKTQHLQLQKIQQNIGKTIQNKTKILGIIAPIQIQIINDCDNNFMPVLRLLIEDTKPAMHKNIINSQLFILPIVSLYFFNPRSSRWEPIIQPFKVAVNYTTININKDPYTSISMKTNSIQEDQTSSLKINVSSQMFSTIMAIKDMVAVEKENIDNDIETKEIQISPFVFHNLTNQRIYLMRGENQILLNPLFHGPIRLIQDKEIIFQIKNKKHKFSLDHYGVLKIPQMNYFIRFGTKKLNRVITFLPMLALKNHLQQPVYLRRFGVSQVPVKLDKNQSIPLDGVEQFAISLNGNSYTQKIKSDAARKVGYLLAEKKNFIILLKCIQKVNQYTFINLLSPFIIFNCLPKDLSMQFIHKAKTKSTVTIKAQKCYSVFASEDISTLQLRVHVNGYTWSTKFKYPADEHEQRLKLQDEDNCKTILNYIFRKDKDTNQFILIIYCKRIIVNQLEDKLIVYANLEIDEKEKNIDKFELLGGQRKDDETFQDKIIMVGEQVGNKLRVCGSGSMMDFATPIRIGGIDSSQARIVVDRFFQGKRQSLFTLIGVEIGGMKMTKQCDIFCKKITLRSKSIVINNTKFDLTIMEEMAKKIKFTCEAGNKKSFVFSMPQIKNKQFRYFISSKGFYPSKLITLLPQGSVFFKLVSQDKETQIYFKIYTQEVETYNFYQISQINQNDFPYEVVVKSNFIKVRISQLNLTARKGDICRFINEGQSQGSHQVELIISHSDSQQELKVNVFPDDLKFKQKYLMVVEKGALQGNVAILVQVAVRDKQKAIIVDELSRFQDVKEVGQSLIAIELAEIIISINQNSQSIEVPFESLVITLRRLFLVKLQTDRKQQYQLKLGFLQIDQGYPYILSSPVILTPYKYELFTKEVQPKSIFNFTIVFSKEFVRNTFISQISVDFDDIVAIFSSDFINLAIQIATQFGEVISFKENTYFIEDKLERWKDLKVPPQVNNVFIKSIKISPFVIDLSAELNMNKLKFENNLLLSTIMSTVGVMMSNIDNAPINMTGIQINDCIDSVDSIVSKLTGHYKSTCLNQLYKVFGSLNIIGNPLSLFRNISTGVKDLTEKPAEGFVKGPAQFGLGIVQGTGSLIAHSVGGAFNSVSKITGTVSTGLAALAFDKDFEEHRQKQKMKKPQNVIQGLSKGGKAILYGFKQGITGVWMQPIQNARKEGALGFFKGAAKGLAGLVIKPVTGIIDFASKTTQGIKNNVLMFEDKPNQTRMRNPRVFYTQCFILKQYSQRDSQLYSIMKKISNEQKFINPIFYDAFQTANGRQFLIILHSSITYLNIQSRKVKWSIEYSDLQLKNDVNKRMLLFKKRGKGHNHFNVDYDVQIEEDQVRELVAQFILTLQRQRMDNL